MDFAIESTLSQRNRFLKIYSCLGEDLLFLKSLKGTENFSCLFNFDLELISPEPSIDPIDMVGDNISLIIDAQDNNPKFFNGYISRFHFTGRKHEKIYGYKALLVPWLWFLKQRTNCRIFQNKTVKEIFEEICDEYGFKDYKFSLIEEHPALEYCVQYEESDFDFISRLFESEGIFYFFEHKRDGHVLKIHDNVHSLNFIKPESVIQHSGTLMQPHIETWQHTYSFYSGQYSQSDYNYERSTNSLLTEASSNTKVKHSKKMHIFKYPGVYNNSEHGKKLARYRMEQFESQFDLISAKSNIKGFALGRLFNFTSEEYLSDNNKNYFINKIVHEAVDSSYSDSENGADYYFNNIECLEEGTPFRPPMVTNIPKIESIQTAFVVGKSADEIYTDEYGRIKIQFHWDRYGEQNENSSCWVRVATQWAGNKWGTISIPRVGQEVVVAFENGNPNRPLVIGSVYNNAHKPPYDLPNKKNIQGIKSRSTKDGSRSNCCEISIDDTIGEEKLFIQSEKDLISKVKNNELKEVDNDLVVTVKNNDTLLVSASRSKQIEENETVIIGVDENVTIGRHSTIVVKGNQSMSVNGDGGRKITGSDSSSFGGSVSMKVGGSYTLSVSGASNVSVGGDSSENISGSKNISAGSSISLSCGGASITLSGGNIILKGSSVVIDSSTTEIN